MSDNKKTAMQVMAERDAAERALRSNQRMAQLPRFTPPFAPRTTPLANSPTAGGEPFMRPNEDRSITSLQALVPIRVATSRPLDGKWSGRALHAHRVLPSLFGGKHYLLQLGYMERLGSPATGEDEEVDTFRLVFVVNLPVDEKTALDDPLAKADASRSAEALIHMINLRRIP
jgi:hypothetical protein